jgi:hypothetical protein
MTRLSISNLPLPLPEFDPELAPLCSGGRKQFETLAEMEAEDRTRIKLLNRQARKGARLVNRRRARRLAKRLAAPRGRQTPASARHMHDLRCRIVGALWKLVRDEC